MVEVYSFSMSTATCKEEEKHCPVALNLVLEVLSSCAGSYSSLAMSNLITGLKAWHLLHGRAWQINSYELKSILHGAAAYTPASSKLPKRLPTTIEFIANIHNFLNLSTLLDVAIFTCLTTTFYCITRLGEFTVATIKDFSPEKHITRGDISEAWDCNDLPVTKFQLPYTKSAKYKGEEAFWASQEGPTDPKAALESHLCVNGATSAAHLFVWKHPKGLCLLSKREFSKRMTQATTAVGLPDLKVVLLQSSPKLWFEPEPIQTGPVVRS